MVLGFEANEYNINSVPDSLPAGMGVCIVRYLDCTGVPYQGYYGRPHSFMGSPLDPIPPISVSDSIYGGCIEIRGQGRLELFGYPGEYEVPIMFRQTYRRYWHYEHPYLVCPFIDTISVSVTANCTTLVDVPLPWSPKVLTEDWYIPGETSYSHGNGLRGKLRVVSMSGADINVQVRTYSNYTSWQRWTRTNSNHTMYGNSLSLEQGYHSVDLIIPYLHSIRIDSVFVRHGAETILSFDIPEKAPIMVQETLESLLEYPDEWVNPLAQVSTVATIRMRPENEKSGNLVSMYFYQNEAESWRFISVFRNGVYLLNSNGQSDWCPISHYVSNVYGTDESGSRILLNVVNQETAIPYLMSIKFDDTSSQIYSYTDIGLGRLGYPRYPSISLISELRALANGENAFLGYNGIRLLNADFSGTVWEVDSLPDYAYWLNREVVFSEQADCCLIINRHTSVSSPVILVDSEGEIQEHFELSEGHFNLVYASSNLDTLMYLSNEGSLHLGIRCIDSSYSDTTLFNRGITYCRFASNRDRLIVMRDDTVSVFSFKDLDLDSAILEFPMQCNGWSVTDFTLLSNDVLVVEMTNESREHRSIALSANTNETLWLSPIRSGYSDSLHLLRLLDKSSSGLLYPWNDGLIRLLELSDIEIQRNFSQPLNAAELR